MTAPGEGFALRPGLSHSHGTTVSDYRRRTLYHHVARTRYRCGVAATGSAPNSAAASPTVTSVTGVIRDRPSRYASTDAYRRATSAPVALKGLRPGVRLGLCQDM